MRIFTSLFVLILTITFGFSQNHVCNESFETARDGNLPADWRVQFANVSPSWGDWLERVHDPTNVETYEGDYGLKISPNGIEQPDGSKNNRIQNWVIGGNGFPSCGPNGSLKTSTLYMISFMVKAENLTTSGTPGLLMWNNQYWEGASGYFYMGIPTGTYDWRQVTSTVTTSSDPTELGGSLYFEMRSLDGGTLWLDMVEFFEVVPSEVRLSASPSMILPSGSSTITARIYDDDDHFIDVATNDITFTINGSGTFAQGASPLTLAAVAGQRQVTFLPSETGEVTITATSPGLTQASVTITVNDLGQPGVPEINIPYGDDVETDYWAYHPYNEDSPNYNPLILSQDSDGNPYTVYDVDDNYGGDIAQAVQAAMDAYAADPNEKAKILLTAGITYFVPDEAIKIYETSHLHFMCEGGTATIKAPATFTGFPTVGGGTSNNMIHIQAHAGDPMEDNYEANNLTQTWKYLAPVRDFYFSNILFDMNGVADKAVGFLITKDVVFDNCEFINYLSYASHAVCFSDNIWFRSCDFTSTTGQMAVLFDGTHGCGFLDCDVDFNTDYGFNFYTNNDCTVDADLDCELDPNEMRMTKYLVVADNRFGLDGGSMTEVVSVSGSQILVKNNELGGDAYVFAQQKSGCNFNTGRRVHAPFYYTNFRVVGNTVNSGVTLNDFFRITNHNNDNCEPADPASPCTNPADYSGYTGNYEVRGNVINGGVLNPARNYHSYPNPPFVTHEEFTGTNANAILTPNYVCGNCYQDALCEADESGVNCLDPEPDYSAFGCYEGAGPVYYLDVDKGSDSYSAEQAQDQNTPWQSFEHAIYNMSPASTLIIREGVYVCDGSEIEIGGDSGELGGTSASAATVIKAETGERVIITGPDVGGGVHEANPIRLRGDYIRLEGIWFGGAWGEGNEFNLGSNSILDIAEGREIIGCTFFGYNSIRDGYYTDLFMHKNRFVRMGVCLDPPAVFMAGRAGTSQYKTKAVFDNNIWVDGKGQAMVGWHSARNIMFTRNIVANVWGGVEFDDIYGEAQGSGPGGDHFVANNLFWNSGQTVSDPCTGTTVDYNAITHNASNMHSINNIMAQGSRIGVSAMIDDLENSSVNKNAIYNTSTYSGDNSVSINDVSEFSNLTSGELTNLFSNISTAFSQTPDQILLDSDIAGYFDLLESGITTTGSTTLENAGQPWVTGSAQMDIGPDVDAPGNCADDFWTDFYQIAGIDGYTGFRKWNTQGNIELTAPSFVFGDGSGSNRNYRGTCNNCWDLDYQVIIAPENATIISLEFLEFDLERDDDYLRIYDGTGAKANTLAEFTGDDLPYNIISNTGTMVLDFDTDGDNNTGKGWKVSYTSTTDEQEPTFYEMLPASVQANVLWWGDHEESDLSDWEDYGTEAYYSGGGIYCTGNSGDTVYGLTTDYKYTGKQGIEATINNAWQAGNGNKAIRYMRWTDKPWDQDGDYFPTDAYYSVWMYFPETYNPNKYSPWDPGDGGWWNVFQFKSDDYEDISQPTWVLNIAHDDSENKMYFYLYSKYNAPFSFTQSQPLEVPEDEWIHVEAYFKKSSGNGNGAITIWQDGVQIFSETNVETTFQEQSVWGIGNYTDHVDGGPVDGSATIYFDDAIVATEPIHPYAFGTWSGASSTDWSTVANWTNGNVPLQLSQVTIPTDGVTNFPVIGNLPDGPAACRELNIESGASVTIGAGKVLTVDKTITNQNGTDGILILSNETATGSLIHQNTGVGATVQRYISAWSSDVHGWHFLSSPVSNQNIQPEFVPNPPTANQDFFKWDEATATWINSKMDDGGSLAWNPVFESTFVLGKGYLTAYDNDQTKSFEQTLNVEDVTFANLSRSGGDYSGWHLLGNPFSSAIAWNDGNWNMTNIAGTAKIWNESNASYTDIPANGVIPAMNGFMVQVTESSGSLTIPAASRTHDDQSWYKNSGYPKIKLLVKDLEQNTAQESTILFHPEATENFDPELDSRFLAGYAPQFYSVSGEQNLSLNALKSPDKNMEIPFHFIKNESADYQLELLENSSGMPLYLEDFKNGNRIKLSETSPYAFTSSNGDEPGRFLLTFLPASLAQPGPDTPKISVNGNVLSISDDNIPFRILIYTSTGQVVFQEISSTKNYSKMLNLQPGVYFVIITGNDTNTSAKVFIW